MSDEIPARPSIGYGSPPPQTRFVKGKSGNPKGQPKGSCASKGGGKAKPASPPPSPILDDIRRRHLETPIKVRDGEGVRELHFVEALLRQIDKLAFAGGVQAGRLALQWHQETMRAREAEHRENTQWVAEYCARYRDHQAACEQAGKPVPDCMPGPEDIHLSREKGLRIDSPYTPETLDTHLLLKRWRDAMHIRMIHDEIVFFDKPGVRITLTTAEFIVHWLDHLMPARWQGSTGALGPVDKPDFQISKVLIQGSFGRSCRDPWIDERSGMVLS